jgi:chitodextrinase
MEGVPDGGSENVPDVDYDSDGAYTVFWAAASDPQSGIKVYLLQEQAGASGKWRTLTSTLRATRFSVSGRLDKGRYFYQVRAQNTAGLWGPFSPPSDGVLVDTTAPTPVTVTDDGATSFSTTTLHATWSAADDPESGVMQYDYLIRQDSTTGTITVNWTSVGLATEVTRAGLRLVLGKKYFFGVRAKNRAGLSSSVRYSDGIIVQPDPTPPTAPGQPTEGTPDADYDSDGAYTISWSAASDPQSGIKAYELQEHLGAAGSWNTLSSALTTTHFSVNGRADQTRYRYQVRAQNHAGRWGPFAPASDGVLIDPTAPTRVTVTDDGATSFSTTTLHATWSAADDPESGVLAYRYAIGTRRSGTEPGPWTVVGLALEVTRTDLSLQDGATYFISVQAQNGAEQWSAAGMSDGITIQADTLPPTGTITINDGKSYTDQPAVTLTLSATDDSGVVAQMRFANEDDAPSPWERYATRKAWTVSRGDGPKRVSVWYRDRAGNESEPSAATITLDTTPPVVTITEPVPGEVFGQH